MNKFNSTFKVQAITNDIDSKLGAALGQLGGMVEELTERCKNFRSEERQIANGETWLQAPSERARRGQLLYIDDGYPRRIALYLHYFIVFRHLVAQENKK